MVRIVARVVSALTTSRVTKDPRITCIDAVKLFVVVGFAALLLACSYNTEFADCTIRCAMDGERCPDGMTCGAENLCRPLESTDTCVDGGVSACTNSGDPIIDLAMFRPASADAFIDAGGIPSNGNDNNDATRWTAASDGTPGHWWQVDLGSERLVESIDTLWEMDGVDYQFYVSVSSDGTNFTTMIDRTTDARAARARADVFPTGTCTRFVRVTKTDTTGYWAILYTVNVMGPDCGTIDSDGDSIPDCRDTCPTNPNPECT